MIQTRPEQYGGWNAAATKSVVKNQNLKDDPEGIQPCKQEHFSECNVETKQDEWAKRFDASDGIDTESVGSGMWNLQFERGFD